MTATLSLALDREGWLTSPDRDTDRILLAAEMLNADGRVGEDIAKSVLNIASAERQAALDRVCRLVSEWHDFDDRLRLCRDDPELYVDRYHDEPVRRIDIDSVVRDDIADLTSERARVMSDLIDAVAELAQHVETEAIE